MKDRSAPKARVIEGTFVAVCTDHEEPTLICASCAYFDARHPDVADQAAEVINRTLAAAVGVRG
ncbi:hypothetical protein ACWDA3_25975 [Nonomuraea rubra]